VSAKSQHVTSERRSTDKARKSGPQLPLYAVVPNRGKGRVLKYDGNGYFVILLPDNVQLHAHRRNIKFTNK